MTHRLQHMAFSLVVSFLFLTASQAQTAVEGTTYYLPKTAMRFILLVERTVFTPGQFADYSELYMKKAPKGTQPTTAYRLVKVDMEPVALPDTAKQFTISVDKKHTLTEVNCTESGQLLALNAAGKTLPKRKPFVPAPQEAPLNPRDFMNEDILRAASSAKMAELCAQEIYDIRDSREQITRGKADFMPKDGEQLRLMLHNLSTQETALKQVFDGLTRCDTTEVSFMYIPTRETERDVLFRFSKKLGLVDKDNLAGVPYYIKVQDLQLNKPEPNPEEDKKIKDDIGLRVNLPGKIAVDLLQEEKPYAHYELFAPQFGRIEVLSGDLFGKKTETSIVLDPLTGAIEHIKSELVK